MKLLQQFVFGLVLLVMAAHQCVNIDVPFLRLRESSLVTFCKNARNQLRFGPGVTRFGLLDVTGPSLAAYSDYRAHFYHCPALTGQTVALTFAVFGESEWSARLVGVAASLGTVTAFYWLVCLLGWDGWKGLIASAVFALNPLFCYFSIVTIHNTLAMFFGCLASSSYWKWRENGRKIYLWLMLGLFFLGAHTHWTIYYFMAAVALHAAIQKPHRLMFSAAVLGAAVLYFCSFLAHLYVLDPAGKAPFDHLLRSLSVRASASQTSLGAYLYGEVREAALYFTVSGLFLAVLGFIQGMRSRKSPEVWLMSCLVLLLADEVWLRGHAQDHPWSMYPGVPFVALAAVSGGAWLWGRGWVARIAVVILAAAGGVQAEMVLRDRLTRFGAYEFYYKMATAARDFSNPNDKIGIVTDDLIHYSRYYLDRYALSYAPQERRLQVESFEGTRENVSIEDALRIFEKEGVRFVVAARKEDVLQAVPFVRGFSEEQFKAFGIDVGRSPVVAALERRYPKSLFRGFTLYHVKRPP